MNGPSIILRIYWLLKRASESSNRANKHVRVREKKDPVPENNDCVLKLKSMLDCQQSLKALRPRTNKGQNFPRHKL